MLTRKTVAHQQDVLLDQTLVRTHSTSSSRLGLRLRASSFSLASPRVSKSLAQSVWPESLPLRADSSSLTLGTWPPPGLLAARHRVSLARIPLTFAIAPAFSIHCPPPCPLSVYPHLSVLHWEWIRLQTRSLFPVAIVPEWNLLRRPALSGSDSLAWLPTCCESSLLLSGSSDLYKSQY